MTQPDPWPSAWGPPPDPNAPTIQLSPSPTLSLVPDPPDHRTGPFPQVPLPQQLRDDAAAFLADYLAQNAPDRGPFVPKKGETQPLPSIALPTSLMTVLNIIAGRPETPYNHDRATLARDLIYLGAAAWVQVLTKWDDSPDLKNAANVIRHHEQLRQGLYTEELLTTYIEDLAMVSGLLSLKLEAGRREPVYDQLQKLMHHAEQIQDRAFWRPIILGLIFKVPEVIECLRFLNESDEYRYRHDVAAWTGIAQRYDEDPDWDFVE